ncbi:MAG: FtsH protease activity modulator HflK [Phycisphaerae bacterium]|nr:FtsH protease activity modulator HflK [Phycisphaerae bacterium]
MQRALYAGRRLLTIIVVFGGVVYLLSGIYSVKNSEVAVHQRFGRVIQDRVPSGIHYALPWPIDRVVKVPSRTVIQRLVVDDFLPGDDPNTAAGLFRLMTQLDSFCVTSDNNVVNIGCAVQYRVEDPAAFLFRPMAPETLLRAIACNSMVHCLARMQVDQALTAGSQRIKQYIHDEMNQVLEGLGVGLVVVSVDLIPVRPPQAVQSYFDDVVNANIDRRKLVSQAQANQNERFARARVESIRLLQQAEAYRATQTAEAKGKAARFDQRLAEYRKAPDVTHRRLYLDFVRDVLSQVPRKYVTDADGGGPAAHMRIVVPQ